MILNVNSRVVVLIDGANLYATTKALQFELDFRLLLAVFRQRSRLVRALYYTAVLDDQEYSSIRPLVDWLGYNGYAPVTKPAREFVDSTGRRRIRGRMDVELAVDAMRLSGCVDEIVLFSGDGDFKYLVAALQQLGKRVTVISSLSTEPVMVADELRRQADQFVDLAQLRPLLERAESERPALLSGQSRSR